MQAYSLTLFRKILIITECISFTVQLSKTSKQTNKTCGRVLLQNSLFFYAQNLITTMSPSMKFMRSAISIWNKILHLQKQENY